MEPEFDIQSLEKLRELLKTRKSIVITTHHKPDGDAMGSSLALFNFLKTGGHDVKVITPSDYPQFLNWMKGNDEVIVFPENKPIAEELTAKAELIFCLDFNQLARLEKYSDHVANSNAVKVLVDHHPHPDDFCDICLSFVDSCATSEILYHLLRDLDATALNDDIAACLYAGIMTDTGSFRFSSTTAETHLVVADLLRIGAVPHQIHERIFDDFTEERTRFLGYCISEKLVVLKDRNAAYISINADEQRKYHVRTGDTEGIVNYALSVRGVRIAALFIEQNDLIKISLRSKGDYPVNQIASDKFNGGGHKNAAGGRSYEPMQQTIEKFIASIQ